MMNLPLPCINDVIAINGYTVTDMHHVRQREDGDGLLYLVEYTFTSTGIAGRQWLTLEDFDYLERSV